MKHIREEINEYAMVEGWAIFFTTGTEDEGDYRIERLDESEKFASDSAAWMHIYNGAQRGNPHHQRALDFIEMNNPTEYQRIMAWCSFKQAVLI